MSDDILRLAALRRVASEAGAVHFNQAIGSIINADAMAGAKIDQSATLTRLLSLYNQLRAAKMYGQDSQYAAASNAMSAAIDAYAKESPGGADKIRKIVAKLSFAGAKTKKATSSAPKK